MSWRRKYEGVSKFKQIQCRYCGATVTWMKYTNGSSYLADVSSKGQVVTGAGNNFNFKPSHKCAYAPSMAAKYEEELVALRIELASLEVETRRIQAMLDDAMEVVPDKATAELIRKAYESLIQGLPAKIADKKNYIAMKESFKARCGMPWQDGQKLTSTPFEQFKA